MANASATCVTPLFPDFDCGVKPKVTRKRRSKRVKDDTPPSLSVLLFPELYPEEYQKLESEMEIAIWERLSREKIHQIQWYMMDRFEEYYTKDDSAIEHYIDYSLWVLLDEESVDSPFSFRNVVIATSGMQPDNFAGIVAMRIMKGSLDYTTKCGDVFRRIRKKYERKLIQLIVELDIPV